MYRSTLWKPLAVCAALVLSAALAALSPKSASATAIYTYKGNPFTTNPFATNNFISGTFTVPTKLLGINFRTIVSELIDVSFSAGPDIINTSNVQVGLIFSIETDPSGNLTKWTISLLSSSTPFMSFQNANPNPSIAIVADTITTTDQVQIAWGKTL